MSLDISYSGGVFSAPQAKSVGTVTAGTGPYNLASASYDSVSFSVGTQETLPMGLFFKPDGTKVYIIGQSSDTVFQYSLSTAWDISTASYDSVSFSVSAQDTTPQDVFFKPDGTKMYIVGKTGDDINEYNLSTAWNVSTASFVQNFSVSTQDAAPTGMSFKPDGTKMYVVGASVGGKVYEYNLSTAWDVSTASYLQTLDISSYQSGAGGLFFSADGYALFSVGNFYDNVNEFSLSTAWDISTASHVGNFSVSSQETDPSAIFFKSDGLKMYVLGYATDTIYQYSTGTATTLDLSTGNYFSYTPTANTTFAFSNAPASGTAAGFALALTGANAAETYDIANASYDSVTFSVSSQEANPDALFFKPDGLKFYIIGIDGDDVNEYDLSTAWDISTASYLQSFSVATEEATPKGLFFKPDGTKMYVTGLSGRDVNEYDLSTAWDVSTASYSQNFSILSQESIPTDLFFKPDGTKMYLIGESGDDVNEYNLSTAWDVSTASYLQNFSVATQDLSPSDLFFNPDGTKMYVTGRVNDSVYEYALSTAWDVSTASYLQNFSVSGQSTSPTGLFFKSDGTKMYIIDNVADAMFQYTTGSTATATFTYPSSVKFPSGTAPAGPAIGETDVLVFYTDDGGTTYQGFRAGNAMA
jgi:DNA-binding beta-propeller fold protein YncE